MSKRNAPLHLEEPLSDVEVEFMVNAFNDIQLDVMDLDGNQVLHSELFDTIKAVAHDLEEGMVIPYRQRAAFKALLPRRVIDT